MVESMTEVQVIELIERYWSLYEIPLEQVQDRALDVFSKDATWFSHKLQTIIKGRDNISRHIETLCRMNAVDGTKSRSQIKCSKTDQCASWHWEITTENKMKLKGMDTIHFIRENHTLLITSIIIS